MAGPPMEFDGRLFWYLEYFDPVDDRVLRAGVSPADRRGRDPVDLVQRHGQGLSPGAAARRVRRAARAVPPHQEFAMKHDDTDVEALREFVRRGLAAQAALDELPTEDDRACLAAIHASDDDRARARLIRDYWHDGVRADRTPRAWAYLHLGLLSGIIDRLLDDRGPAA
jgi:hypothetical protein